MNFTEQQIEALKGSIMGWIMMNKLKNEQNQPIEFSKHNFLIEPYCDWHPRQVCMKSAQVGYTTMSSIKGLYAAKYRDLNICYTFPTWDDIRIFVPEKVDRIIKNNPVLVKAIGTGGADALTKKEVGNRFMHFRGAHKEKAALSVTSDLNMYDEYDASEPSVVDMYSSRLQYSEYKGEWFFSNPVYPGRIDRKYSESDMKQWTIQCSRCNHYQPLDYFKNIDKKNKIYICEKCKKELSEADRLNGRWVAAYPSRSNEAHGYHINQLMCSWVQADHLIRQEKNKSSKAFYNMILGLPYVEKDQQVTPDVIKENLITGENNMLRNAIGVDVGWNRKHFVLGNRKGVFKVGVFKTWDEFDVIMRKFNPIAVVDYSPDPYVTQELIHKYPNQVYACRYQKDKFKKNDFVFGRKDKSGIVAADKDLMIQGIVNDFVDKKFKINCFGKDKTAFMNSELREFVEHWGNIHRETVEDHMGIPHSKWVKSSNEDHFVQACVYFKIGLSRVEEEENIVQGIQDYARMGLTMADGSMPAQGLVFEEKSSPDRWKYV